MGFHSSVHIGITPVSFRPGETSLLVQTCHIRNQGNAHQSSWRMDPYQSHTFSVWNYTESWNAYRYCSKAFLLNRSLFLHIPFFPVSAVPAGYTQSMVKCAVSTWRIQCPYIIETAILAEDKFFHIASFASFCLIIRECWQDKTSHSRFSPSAQNQSPLTYDPNNVVLLQQIRSSIHLQSLQRTSGSQLITM